LPVVDVFAGQRAGAEVGTAHRTTSAIPP
jgi:hypothetical protein